MVVNQVLLEFQDLLIVQDLFRELADAGVGTVHDLFGSQFLFQHRPADLDAFERSRSKRHRFTMAGNGDQFFNGQVGTVEEHSHKISFE